MFGIQFPGAARLRKAVRDGITYELYSDLIMKQTNNETKETKEKYLDESSVSEALQNFDAEFHVSTNSNSDNVENFK